MKKVTLIIATIAMLGIVSCKETKEESKTVVVEQEAAPATEEPKEGTSLSVGSDGVEFSTNDGESQTEIDINTKDEK
ncbi:hypothetical protein [Flavobacterium okayamense]|uniref:Uncharacterized protein n=1 Tax=Flavobacterium okayamense TaxID=2830782 RepID=A0ABN6HYD8_9FLAO|nr:hypothetical protein [Flavobacterium okayamense]BCY29370.1 hypothetical protein KK2020170_22380 [Flavobacterium okayamense]